MYCHRIVGTGSYTTSSTNMYNTVHSLTWMATSMLPATHGPTGTIKPVVATAGAGGGRGAFSIGVLAGGTTVLRGGSTSFPSPMPQCRQTGTEFTGQTGGAAVGASGARPTHSIADGPRKETAKETAKPRKKPRKKPRNHV